MNTDQFRLSGAVDLVSWSNRDWSDGVQLDALQDLDVLTVRTRNSTYELTIVSCRKSEVLVRGGQFFPEPTPVYLAGSSLGGSFLKRHGIYVGLRMELHHDAQATITTQVQSIARVDPRNGTRPH
jgi:hypothetical protein